MARFGSAHKWLIVKSKGCWAVCPPVSDGSGTRWPHGRGGALFSTGAAAIAKFAAAGGPA